MCGKGSKQVTTQAPPAYIQSAQQGVINQATQAASTPYQAYTGELTAGQNATQTNAASSLANIGSLSAADIQKYMSPYTQNVVDATQANINESNAEQQQQLQGNAISSGAWGGDRAGVAQAELARQQNLAGQQTIANLYNTGYGQAVSTAQQQQQQQSANAQALYGIGTQQQQTQQNADTAAYNQYVQQQQYPFATAQYLSNIVGQQAAGAGGTTTQTQSGNLFSDILGGVATIAGTPSGGGGTVGGDVLGFLGLKDGGAVRHRAMGGPNVMNMADAIRALPPHVLAALHARMGGNPMLQQAAPMQMPARGFADGGMPYSLGDGVSDPTGLPVPSISSIVPLQNQQPSIANLPATTIPAPTPANDTTVPPASLAATGTSDGTSWADQASRSPLLAFGLGTLAGSNNPGASAIGRGGLAALQGIEGRRKTDLDLALEREQLRGAGTENSLRDLQLKAYQDLANPDGTPSAGPTDVAGHVSSLMNDAGSPVPASSDATPAPAQTAPSLPASGGAAPLFNTASLMRQYQIASRTPGMENLATHLLEVINKGVPEGNYLGQDGGIYARPGYLSGVSAKAAAEANARSVNTPHFTPTHDLMGNPMSFDTKTGQAVPLASDTQGGGSGPLSLEDWSAKMQGLENGTGNPGAQNPRSTATGNGQFIDSTWLSTIKGARPDLAKTMSDNQLLALRSDPAVSAQMTAVNARNNAAALTQANEPVNASTLALAHRFGPDGVKAILDAPQDAPLSTILPSAVLKANPDLANQTAGGYVTKIAGQMGVTPVDLGGSTSAIVTPKDMTPASVDTVAKAIAGYRMAPLSGFVMKTPWGQAVAAKITELNPDYRAGEFTNINRTISAFGSGQQGDQVRFFNTSLGHMGTLANLVSALGNNDVKALNSIKQTFSDQFGQTAPTNFDAAKQIVGQEIVKAIVGKGGGVHEREAAADSVNRANSPQQLLGVINNVWKPLAAEQLNGLRRQYEGNSHMTDFYDKLSPGAIQVLGMPVGATYKGHTYLGGDMSKPSSWKKAGT